MNKCKLCEAFYQKYPLQYDEEDKKSRHVIEIEENSWKYSSDPIQCAFENDVFSTDNWSCETMDALRSLAINDYGDEPYSNPGCWYYRDDMCAASLGIVRIPESEVEDIQQGYVIMSWYKMRGRTGQAYVLYDDKKPEPLTLKTAEWILEKTQKP